MAETNRPNLEVVTSDATPSLGKEPSKEKPREKASGPKKPKWEVQARERLKAAVRRYSRPLSDMADRDANEGDTRLLVTDFLCDGLGYDKYEDLSTEYQVKGEFAEQEQQEGVEEAPLRFFRFALVTVP
jgi:hypothetical protein